MNENSIHSNFRNFDITAAILLINFDEHFSEFHRCVRKCQNWLIIEDTLQNIVKIPWNLRIWWQYFFVPNELRAFRRGHYWRAARARLLVVFKKRKKWKILNSTMRAKKKEKKRLDEKFVDTAKNQPLKVRLHDPRGAGRDLSGSAVTRRTAA